MAIKQLVLAGVATDEERLAARARLRGEARLAARVDHPGTVGIFEIAEEAGEPWIVMEALTGRTQLCDGARVVLTDFGIAATTGDGSDDVDGKVSGSPAYMGLLAKEPGRRLDPARPRRCSPADGGHAETTAGRISGLARRV